MKTLIKHMTLHPTAANLLMVIFLVLGISQLPHLEREPSPDISPSEVEVLVKYPGASAERTEAALCIPLEEALQSISHLYEIRTQATENLCRATLEMQTSGNMIDFNDEIKTAITAIDVFPDQAEVPVVRQLGISEPALSILVSGISQPKVLKAYAEQLKSELLSLPEVNEINILGFSQSQISIELSATALKRYRLSASDVAKKISQQALDIPTGLIETKNEELRIRFKEERYTPTELAPLVILETPNGAQVTLAELGTLKETFASAEDKIEVNGQRAAKLQIRKSKSEDALRLSKAVSSFIENKKEMSPSSIHFSIVEDVTLGLKSQIRLVLINGIQGMLLVFLTLWLFFNIKLSFWVVMGLPVSFLGAVFFMPYFNLSINFFTLIGLLLSLGILMDDAIVLAENVVSHLKKGSPPIKATLDGINEVKVGVFYSFLTTVGVLGPLSFITGDIGKLLRVVPLVLILVLLVSLLEAFLILPSHLSHALSTQKESNWRQGFQTRFQWIEKQVGFISHLCIRYRYLTLSITLGSLMILIGIFASGRLPFVPLPDLEGDLIRATVLMPAGTPLEKTEHVVQRLETTLRATAKDYQAQYNSVEPLVRVVSAQYGENPEAHESGPHTAMLMVELLTAEQREGSIDDYLKTWRKKLGPVPEAESIIMGEPNYGAAGRAIHIRLQNKELKTLKAASQDIQQWLYQFQGVFHLQEDLHLGKTEWVMHLKAGAERFGLSVEDIGRQMQAAYLGIDAYTFQEGPDEVHVEVSLQNDKNKPIQHIENFPIRLPSGKLAPLSHLVIFTPQQGWSSIQRVNGERTLSLYGEVDVKQTNADSIFRLFKTYQTNTLTKRFPGVKVHLEGQVKEAGKTRLSMLKSLLTGLGVVFVLLSLQFRSYLEPLIVMIAIPFSLIGVFGGHLLLGFPFTMPSLLGFISLTGIVVNDSLLLVMFIKQARTQKIDAINAASQASQDRFQAVLLTSLTTIVGLLPMLLEQSLQAQILKGLVISICFGLMVSTLLVLFLVPSVYVILEDLGWTHQREYP